MNNGVEARLELFEGPVELLLYLVRKKELDVFDVPIGQLTDDFLAFVRGTAELNLEAAADFLVMAGVLLRLKMRQLLPRPGDEELDTPTVSLEQILDEFRRFQRAAHVLSEKEEDRRRLFPRVATLPQSRLAENEDLSVLTQAFQRVLKRIRSAPIVEVAPRKVRFEDRLDELRRLLRANDRLDFEQLLVNNTLTEAIITFIAILELVRLGELRVHQDEQFGTITLERRSEPPAPQPA